MDTNIFANADSFLGEIRTDDFERAIAEFFTVTADIRERLGSNRTLLADYLDTVLDVICRNHVETTATHGFSIYGRELRGICLGIIRSSNENTQHPFYETAKRYIDEYPTSYKNVHRKLDMYAVALTGEFIKYATERYRAEYTSKLESSGSIARIESLYKGISGILGTEEPMERVNAIIRNGMRTVPVMAVVAQGIIDMAFYALASSYAIEIMDGTE